MFEDLPSLSPVQFFGISADCLFCPKGRLKKEKQFLLPPTTELLSEESFADLYAAWNFEKLLFLAVVEGEPVEGSSVELFLDTRDLKSKGVISRFCHHFIFQPVQVGGFYGREITRFRGEDVHRLCHPEDLSITPTLKKGSYTLEIEIPAQCLTGFDPMSFSRLGFTYRINRPNAPSQHFAVSSEEYVIEQHPATWGTLKLVKEND
ncbi:MAG TPA: hypothetical protein VGM34_01845 [Chlamydiales bacterium]